MATITILGHLDQKIRDAVDGARSAGAALARSAHEIVDCAHAETTATAEGTAGRAQLIDRETVRVLLTGVNLARLDGMLDAYGIVLRLIDRAREDEVSDKRAEIEAEAERDARTYRQAVELEAETTPPQTWAYGAADSMLDDLTELGPLSADEAKAIYVAAFMRAIEAKS